MKRLALLLGTLALAAAFHSRAQAQAIQNPLIVKRADEQIPTAQIIYGTVEDCEKNVEFEFGADFPTTVPIWEAWVGVGSGADCANVMNRRKASATAQNPICKLVGTDVEASARPRISNVKARDLFSKDWNATTCDEVRGQAYTVFLLPLEQETNLSADSASPVIPVGAFSTLKATFTLYTLPPDPPGGLKPVTGESRIGVKFNVMEGAQAKTRYRAYFDWGTGGSGECGSGVLEGETGGVAEPEPEELDAGVETGAEADPDAETDTDAAADTGAAADPGVDAGTDVGSGRGTRPPDDGTPRVASETVTAGEAYLGDLTAKGIEIGDSVAVSVVTLDAADNESDLATPICVQRIETSSFIDNCEADPECKDGFTACSLSPGQRSGGLLGLGALFALGAALVLRRRRHV